MTHCLLSLKGFTSVGCTRGSSGSLAAIYWTKLKQNTHRKMTAKKLIFGASLAPGFSPLLLCWHWSRRETKNALGVYTYHNDRWVWGGYGDCPTTSMQGLDQRKCLRITLDHVNVWNTASLVFLCVKLTWAIPLPSTFCPCHLTIAHRLLICLFFPSSPFVWSANSMQALGGHPPRAWVRG